MLQSTDIIPQATLSSDTFPQITVLKINDVNIHIKNSFYPDKNLYDILFSLVSTRLKEKLA